MKAKKIIIGLIAVIALLVTIAGALADTSISTWQPNNNSVTTTQSQPVNFSLTIANPEQMTLKYQWFVDNGNTPVFSEDKSDATWTSSYPYSGTTLGSHIVSVFVTGGTTPLQHTWTVTVEEAAPASLLSITKIKVNGKTNGKLKPGEVNEVEVEVSNDYTKKIEDISVTVDLLDQEDSVTDADDTINKLLSGDKESITLELDLRDEDLDQDDYTLKVDVEGDAIDNTKHSDSENQTLSVDRKKDDIIITKTNLEDSQVVCSASTKDTLKVRVKNVGENDQNGAKITVKNAELDLNLQKENIDLDDYSGSDNEYDATFALNLEDAVSGPYTLDVAVYSEGNDLMDSKEVELQVQCANAAEKPAKEETGATEYYADQKLAAELQQKLDEYKVMQQSQSASQGSFRESNAYIMMLGILVAMMFFAAALSVTYLLVKRK